MKVLPLSEVKTKLSELVARIERRGEAITITRNGKAVAMIVSLSEYEERHETSEILNDVELLGEIRQGIRVLTRARKRFTVDELLNT